MLEESLSLRVSPLVDPNGVESDIEDVFEVIELWDGADLETEY